MGKMARRLFGISACSTAAAAALKKTSRSPWMMNAGWVMAPRSNPRLSTGGDLRGLRRQPVRRAVSIHASAREVTDRRQPRGRGQTTFQSTPPHGRRRDREGAVGRKRARFNPRLRTGGDDRRSRAAARLLGFNPRLRTGGDPRGRPWPVRHCVSIHASAREATAGGAPGSLAPGAVSIHASAREATGYSLGQLGQWIVSIHASAREATRASSTTGCRFWGFQSTPPHGRRRRHAGSPGLLFGFNPRIRTGGDQGLAAWGCLMRVSIHASAREATLLASKANPDIDPFQSTPPHGRRRRAAHPDGYRPHVSIHASAREATMAVHDEVQRFLVSIHASAREATMDGARGGPLYQGFNPRLRTGGDRDWHSSGSISPEFQSTPQHGRRHLWPCHRLLVRPVSIHASAREATLPGCC